MLGRPVYAKLNNGNGAVIMGNGYNSTDGKAVLYIFILDTAGQVTNVKKLDTLVAGDNGLATPVAFDTNADGKVDYIYAGDLKGNVWKFDIRDALPANWKIPFTSKPLFTAMDSSNVPQPITAPLLVAKDSLKDDAKRFIFFGTGSYFRSTDPSDMQVNSWYGLIDDDLNVINSDKSELKLRSIADEAVIDGKPLRTFNSATADDMADKKGWYINFSTQAGERVDTTSQLITSVKPVLEVSSRIPITDDTCKPEGKGSNNSISPFTGAGLDFGFFDVNGNGDFTDDLLNGRFIGGIDLGVGMPSEAVRVGNWLVVGGSSGLGKIKINPGITPLKGRISWREIVRD